MILFYLVFTKSNTILKNIVTAYLALKDTYRETLEQFKRRFLLMRNVL